MGWRPIRHPEARQAGYRVGFDRDHLAAAWRFWLGALLLISVAVVGLAVAFVAIGFPSLAVPVALYLTGVLSAVVFFELRRASGSERHRRAAAAEASTSAALLEATTKGWVLRSAIPLRDRDLDHLLIGDERIILIETTHTTEPWDIADGGVQLVSGDALPRLQARSRTAKQLAAGSDRTVTRDAWLVVYGHRGVRPTPAQVREVLVLKPRDLARAIAELPPVANRVRRDQWVERVDGYLDRSRVTEEASPLRRDGAAAGPGVPSPARRRAWR